MDHKLVTYKNSKISYYRFGKGGRIAVCFHGYGENAKSFGVLQAVAADDFTFYSIDLPFHGETIWREGLNFTNTDLVNIVQFILEIENPSIKVHEQKITLLGFSLGGRMALSYYQSRPYQVERILFMAPDGLKLNFWYWLATQTTVGNKFFYFTMKHPSWFFGFLKLLNKLSLVNASVFKFISYYIADPVVRKLLYDRWTTLRLIKPDLKKIKSQILANNTIVRLIYGKHDRIILPIRGEKFCKGIESNCQMEIIESGHQVLHEKHVRAILRHLKGS